MTRPVFGVAFHIDGRDEPLEVTHEELLALRAFDHVAFDPRKCRFRNLGASAEVLAFIKEFRSGGAQ